MLSTKLRITKWVLTLSALILLVAFVYSSRRAVSKVSNDLRHEYSLMLGRLEFAWRTSDWDPTAEKYPQRAGWSMAEHGWQPKLRWGFHTTHLQSCEGFAVPLWPFWLVATAVVIPLWYRDRHATRSVLQRLSNHFRPRVRLRLTIWRAAVACVGHIAALSIASWVEIQLLNFFVFSPADERSFAAVCLTGVGYLLLVFLVGTPAWGVLWAWLYVKWRNRLLMSHPALDCVMCGYDLTGNVTGICSECGQKLLTAQIEQTRPHPQSAARGSQSL